MTTKFAGNATVAGKGTKNKQGRAKSPSLTPDYSPNHRKLEKPQVTSQVNQGTFFILFLYWQYSQVWYNFHYSSK